MKRVNLFDAAVAGFVIVLIPIAYGTFRLFRTPQPVITSVKRVEITKEERRVGGPNLVAKLKIQGSGLRPMLRASIDGAPAIGFVFETPNSADLLVGSVPPGSHDLVLYDGVQEVARASKAVRLQAPVVSRIRIVGTIVGIDQTTSDLLKAGASYPAGSPSPTTIVQLGPARPDRRRLAVAGRAAEFPIAGVLARDAVVSVACDPDLLVNDCAIAGQGLSAAPAQMIIINGPVAMIFSVGEVLPDAAPQTAVVRVRFEGSREVVDLMKAGDRDALLDERAAVVTDIGKRQGSSDETLVDTTLRLGADVMSTGWSYRGHELKPGQTFTLATPAYLVTGTVLSVSTGDKK